MKVVSLSCTHCGASITNKKGGKYRCEFCGADFLIDDENENYTIKAGKLESYNGSSLIISITDNVSIIGRGAFANLETIESITLPQTLIKIEDEAFWGCKALKEIVIPASVKHIGQRAFKGSGVTRVVIEGELEYLGAEAFMQCENLTSVALLNKLHGECTKIFKQCRQLSNVDIDKSIVSPCFSPSMEANKQGDSRPTYFDLFQGTPFFEEKHAQYTQKSCIYCRGKINISHVCENCGTKYYQRAGGCYIATCVYGSYNCEPVWVLRRYRDNNLATKWYGRLFIRLYYAASPTLVKWFGHKSWFRKIWKKKLDRLVKKLQEKGMASTPYQDKI